MTQFDDFIKESINNDNSLTLSFIKERDNNDQAILEAIGILLTRVPAITFDTWYKKYKRQSMEGITITPAVKTKRNQPE